MRRSPHVRLTLLPWLATLALAHLQSGCAEFWDDGVEDASEAANATSCGPDEVPVDPKNCPDDDDDTLCCAQEVAVADSVGSVGGEAYLGPIAPVPGGVRVHRGGFGHYFWTGGG